MGFGLQQAANFRHQLLRRLGLGQEQVGKFNRLRSLGVARQHDDGQTGTEPFEFGTELSAVAGQAVIHDYQIHGLRLGQLQPSVGGIGGQDGKAMLFQNAGKSEQHDVVIVDNQETLWGWHNYLFQTGVGGGRAFGHLRPVADFQLGSRGERDRLP